MSRDQWHERSFRTKKCAGCGNEFVPVVGSQKRCRAACGLEKQCGVCGKQFRPHRSLKKPPQGSCSFKCARSIQGFSQKKCETCRRIFEPTSANSHYCSEGCKFGRATCRICKREFVRTKNTSGRFCSQECHYAVYAPTGTRRPNSDGYMMIRTEKIPGKRRWTMEHRAVMETTLKRALKPWETVHHKNGNRRDNRPDNLELWKGKHGKGIRAADYHCPGCRCFEREAANGAL